MNIWIITTKINSNRILNVLETDPIVRTAVETCNRNLYYERPVRHLYLEAKKKGFNVQVLEPADISFVMSNESCQFFIRGTEVPLPDVVIPRAGSGTDYTLASTYRCLEALGVYMVNCADSILLAADKFHSLQKLGEAGLPIPKSMLITSGFKYATNEEIIANHFSFPLIVKIWPGTNGAGVMLAHDKYTLADIILMLRKTNPDTKIMIQEYVATSKGRDIRTVVLNGEVISMVERNAMDGGFKSNIARNGKFTEIPMNDQVREIAIKAAQCLDLEFTGVDILYADNTYKICELNSSPGFASMEQFGLNPPAILYDYLLKKMKKNEVDSYHI